MTTIAYAARSAAEDDDRASTDSQLEAIRARLDGEPDAVFSESGFSGSKRNRGPALEAAIDAAVGAAAEYGHAELWAFHSSRFGRGSGHLGEARSLLELFTAMRRQGVALRTVEDDDFVTNEQLIGIASSQAAKYAQDLSAYTSAGVKRRKDRGAPVGAMPFGYAVEKTVVEGQVIASRVVDPACPVKEMFAMISTGASPGEVARMLNARRVTTRRGGTWTARAIRQLVANDAYRAGSGYPRIVEDATWEKANAQLRRLDPVARQARKGGRPTDASYILKGVAFCRCGAPMYCTTGRYGSHQWQVRHYVCKHRVESSGVCDAPPVSADIAEYRVLGHLKAFVGDVEAWAAKRTVDHEQEEAERDAAVTRATQARAALDRRLRSAEGELDRALDAGEGVEVWVGQIERIRAERDEANVATARAESARAEFDTSPEEEAAEGFCSRVSEQLGGVVLGVAAMTEVGAEEIGRTLRDTLESITLWTEDGLPQAEFKLRVEREELSSRGTSTPTFRAPVSLTPMEVPA